MELGIKCYECRFVFDDGVSRKTMVNYVFTKAKDENIIKEYLENKFCHNNDDFISRLQINEIQVMEGVVL